MSTYPLLPGFHPTQDINVSLNLFSFTN